MRAFDSEYKYNKEQGKLAHSGGNDGGSMDLESRVAKIESHVEHIDNSISEVKTEIKEFKAEVRADLKDINNRLWTVFLWLIGIFVTISLAGFGTIISLLLRQSH